MNRDNPHLKILIVDGQEIVVPDAKGWEEMRKFPQEIDGQKTWIFESRDFINRTLNFTGRYPQFELGLFQTQSKRWMHIVVMNAAGKLQRVQIEGHQCENCNWFGGVANSTVSDLYITFPNKEKWELVRKAAEQPVCPCPQCGNKLWGHPIWVEPIHRLSGDEK